MEGMGDHRHAELVRRTLAAMRAAGQRTQPVPGHVGLELPRAVTMAQGTWTGLVELAGNADFIAYGRFTHHDAELIETEAQHWLGPERETLFRCRACGKWSHAKTKPAKHRRFLPEDIYSEPPEHTPGLVYHPSEHDFAGSTIIGGGWSIDCGPFDTYITNPR